MSLKEEIGTILRFVTKFAEEDKPAVRQKSKSLSQALKRLDNETEEIKKEAAGRTNTDVLMQMLEKIK